MSIAKLWFCITVGCVLVPSGGSACSPTVPEMEQLARRDRQIEEQYLQQLFRDADYVVIGTVVDVTESNDAVYVQQAQISVERTIKGTLVPRVTALMYKREQSKTPGGEDELAMDEIVPCGAPYKPSREDAYTIQTARGLFYIQAGVLMRVNSFPIEPQLLLFDTKAEVEFLEKELQ